MLYRTGFSDVTFSYTLAAHRRWRELIGAAAVVLAFAGCGGGSSADGPDAAADPAPDGDDPDAGLVCSGGTSRCESSCVDLDVDPANCGSCGNECAAGEVCSGGSCELSCQEGLVECGGTCVDPDTDRQYCGASGDCTGDSAGATCGDGFVCDGSGECALSCQEGLVECGGTCIDPASNPAHCGASGDCTGDAAGTACASGEACVTGSCEAVAFDTLYFSQDGNPDGLFEVDLETGAATQIGVTSSDAGNVALAYDRGADVLYGSTPGSFVHITADGSTARQVSGDVNLIEGMTHDPSTGTTYGALNGALFEVDEADGSPGSELSGPGFDVEGLAVDSAAGVIYGVGDALDLVAYDISGDAWSTIGSTGLNFGSAGLAYDPDAGALYGVRGADCTLYRIAPDTAEASEVGDLGLHDCGGGLAFARRVQE